MELFTANFLATPLSWFVCLQIIVLSLCVGSLLNVIILRLPDILLAKNFINTRHASCEDSSLNVNQTSVDEPANDYLSSVAIDPKTETETETEKQKHSQADAATRAKATDDQHKQSYLYLAWPRSHCPGCKQTLRSIDLIPLFSFLILKGRCYFCETKISWRYPAVELITVLISLFWVWNLGVTIPAFLSIVFSLLLLTLSLIDQDVGLLPDGLTYSGIWLGLLVSLSYFFIGPQQAILGAMFGYLFLWLIATVYRFLRGHDGMGYGDCKMLAMLGAWVGVQAVVYIVILASGLAIGVALVCMFRKRLDLQQQISFGPYLAAAGAAIFLYQSYARGFLH